MSNESFLETLLKVNDYAEKELSEMHIGDKLTITNFSEVKELMNDILRDFMKEMGREVDEEEEDV